MIVAKKSGPTQGRPFFETIRNLSSEVGPIVAANLEEFILRGLTKDRTRRVRIRALLTLP